jgi:hypothetical protein
MEFGSRSYIDGIKVEIKGDDI